MAAQTPARVFRDQTYYINRKQTAKVLGIDPSQLSMKTTSLCKSLKRTMLSFPNYKGEYPYYDEKEVYALKEFSEQAKHFKMEILVAIDEATRQGLVPLLTDIAKEIGCTTHGFYNTKAKSKFGMDKSRTLYHYLKDRGYEFDYYGWDEKVIMNKDYTWIRVTA